MKPRNSAEHDHDRTQAGFQKLDISLVVDAGRHHSTPQVEQLSKRLLLHLQSEIIPVNRYSNTRIGPEKHPVPLEDIGVLHWKDVG